LDQIQFTAILVSIEYINVALESKEDYLLIILSNVRVSLNAQSTPPHAQSVLTCAIYSIACTIYSITCTIYSITYTIYSIAFAFGWS